MKFSIHTDDLLVKTALFFPSTVLLQGLPGFGWINKAIIAVMAFLMLWQMKGNRRTMIAMLLCGVMTVITVVMSNRAYFRGQDIFYFPLFVLYLLYWTERSGEFGPTLRDNLTFGILSIMLWMLLVGVSVFFTRSYVHLTMNTVFFRSFSNQPFRLASSCLIVMLMIYILAYHRKTVWFLLEVIPLIVIFATGSRIYLLIGIGLFVCFLYLIFKQKRVFYISLIPVMAVLAFAVVNSSIIDKFVLVARSQETLYGNFLDAFTSGRTVFWRLDLEAFFGLPVWRQLIGNGVSFPYEVTAMKYVASIWAHNDFVNILMAYGWTGLAMYLYSFLVFTWRNSKTHSLNVIFCLAAVGISMGNAFINGLYFYSAAMLATPFLYYALSLDRSKRTES